MKALLATPLHYGTADSEFINGLLYAHGLYAGWVCFSGQANICLARDTLAARFLDTDCTTLVFIDGDIGFGRQDLELLLNSPHPITCGLYQRKNSSGGWVSHPQPEHALVDEHNPSLRRVERAGTGFMRIDREVFQTLVEDRYVNSYLIGSKTINEFFPTGVFNGEFLTEDYYFCELAKGAGYSIYADTRIRLAHAGRFIYQERLE